MLFPSRLSLFLCFPSEISCIFGFGAHHQSSTRMCASPRAISLPRIASSPRIPASPNIFTLSLRYAPDRMTRSALFSASRRPRAYRVTVHFRYARPIAHCPLATIRVNSESVSNEIDESDLQYEKHDEQRI
jgi:hypothetical protein